MILFNEHFVVYGIPAIVSAIGDSTNATVKSQSRGNADAPAFQIIDNRPETPGYKTKKQEQQNRSIELMLHSAGIDLGEQS